MTTTPTKNESLPETFPIFVVYTNTDLTEGRGFQYPIAWTEFGATARRLAHKKGVMGSDAEVREMIGIRFDGRNYGPVRLELATDEDKEKEAKAKIRRDAIEKAKQAGLSDDDLAAIMGVKR